MASSSQRPPPPRRPPPLPIPPPNYQFMMGTPSPDVVMSPGSFVAPYKLTDRQLAFVNAIWSLRLVMQNANPHHKNDKATVIADKRLYLTGAFIAECYYSTNWDTVLVSCLTQREGIPAESRPDSIFAYNVKDCGSINILRKIDPIVEWIDNRLADGKTVIIHCYAGINRSASIALAYHCLKTGNDIVTGFKYLAEQRPGILSNKNFIEQLVIWADAHNLLPKEKTE